MNDLASPIDGAPSPPAEEKKLELLPCTFTCGGREWTIRFTDSLLTKIKDLTQLDLWKSIEIQNSPLVALAEDERKLRTAVVEAIKEQLEAHAVQLTDFVDAFCGDAFDAAFVAVQGGLERFFSARRRASLRQAIHFLEMRGKAELEHQATAYATGLQEVKEAGKTAIENMKPEIRKAVIQDSKRRVSDALSQAMRSEPTSSNAAATLGSNQPI